eukprot:Selendium_serpulae@DN4987_c0_g1_i1.p1
MHQRPDRSEALELETNSSDRLNHRQADLPLSRGPTHSMNNNPFSGADQNSDRRVMGSAQQQVGQQPPQQLGTIAQLNQEQSAGPQQCSVPMSQGDQYSSTSLGNNHLQAPWPERIQIGEKSPSPNSSSEGIAMPGKQLVPNRESLERLAKTLQPSSGSLNTT